jgi:mono/diheme cytochrome c family protein
MSRGTVSAAAALMIVVLAAGCSEPVAQRKTALLGLARLSRTGQETVLEGKQLYEQYCAGCHGANGDGRGPAAAMLLTQPRDFTRANFKFKLTTSGSLPGDDDLYRTISNGVARTSMPAWSLLPDKERRALVQYLKTFSGRWQAEKPARPLAIPEPPVTLGSLDLVVKGKGVYARMQCGKCHGDRGRGDGPSAEGLTDSEGHPIKVFDFTLGLLKGGRSVKDIYRTFTAGLDGTPMPAYGDVLSEEERWQLISYVLHLMRKTRVTEEDVRRSEQAAAVPSKS